MERVFRTSCFGIEGTVTLVALCFVIVLGITLAGYIAVCSRAMNLSNRSFQARTSQQLAEMGIDEALRAFNKNNWASWGPTNGITVTWDTATYAASKRAVATIAFPAGKFGQGVTGSVKIRVDNYDAAQLNSTWSNTATYRINDLVGYSGTWYRCVQNHSPSQTPSGIGNLSYWVPEPIASTWVSGQPYSVQDMVFYGTQWRRCKTAHTSSASILPTNGSYWVSIPNIFSTINAGTSYNINEVAYYGSPYNTWVHRTTAGLGSDIAGWDYAPISWRWDSTKTYDYNDVVYYNATWYRYIRSTPTSGAATTAPGYWETAMTMFGWSSGINYSLGDVVYYSATSQWYRCLRANTSSSSLTPSNTTYWANAPLYSTAWDSNRQYGVADTVRFNGVWYRCLVSNNGSVPTSSTTNWASSANSSYQWSASTAYTVGNYIAYGDTWYKCTTANTGHSPNETAYWTATWANSFGGTTGAPVVYAEGTVSIANNPPVRTQLRATIAPAPLFPNAVAATSTISANGGGTVDSYDGSVYSMNPGGTYNTYAYNQTTSPFSAGSPNLGYSAVVAAGEPSTTAISLSGALTISGYVAAPSASSPSPYAPLFSYGTSVIVKGTSATPSPKVDLSRVSRSPSIPLFDILPAGGLASGWTTMPKGTALALAATTNIGTPGATTPSRYYSSGDLSLSSSAPTTLNINGPVILYINGSLILDGSSSPNGNIVIASTGSAEIHLNQSVKVYAGSDGITNKTLDPKKLIITSDNSSTSPQLYSDGSTPLYGVIYIPYSTGSLGLYNDNASVQVYGAISANKVTYSGASLNVHYDTSLRYATFGGIDQPYTVTDWRELSVDEQATMP